MAKPANTGVERVADDRLRITSGARSVLNHVFPRHWSFLLGEVAAYSFLVLVATGIYLALFFEPSSAPTTYEGSYAPMRGVEVSHSYESAMRLAGPWALDLGPYYLSELFIPAVLLPAMIFLALYAWPFLDRCLTGDREPHQVLDRPTDRPGRLSFGVGAFTFYAVLFVAGSQT